MVTAAISKAMTKIFGSRNERLIKTYRRRVELINSLEGNVRKMTDAQMKRAGGRVVCEAFGRGR